MKLLIIISLFIVGCTTNPVWVEPDNYEMALDGRLQKKNGGQVYDLTLLRDRVQTIHRISGSLLSDGDVPYMEQKIQFESSHYWSFSQGDTIITIYRRNVDMNGRWVVVDTQTVVAPDSMVVPTVNEWSYTDKKGEFSSVIAPTVWMVGDTITIKATWTSKWYQTDTIRKFIRIALH
jgi:hypothetical protein